MRNTFLFTKTYIDAEKFLEGTGNAYKYVGQRPFLDKSGKIGMDGVIVTLLILDDKTDYGVDKRTGKPRESNALETFEATILTGETTIDLTKGDLVSLQDFDMANSYVIGFDLIMRFRGIKKIKEG